MDTSITNLSAGNRNRRGGVILTDRMCRKRVTARTKVYDRECPGLYVSITTAGVASFAFKFTDPASGKQRSTVLGIYNPETFTVSGIAPAELDAVRVQQGSLIALKAAAATGAVVGLADAAASVPDHDESARLIPTSHGR